MVLEGYRRCPDSHDLSECHHLYDLGRHISPSYKFNSVNFDSKRLSIETVWDNLKKQEYACLKENWLDQNSIHQCSLTCPFAEVSYFIDWLEKKNRQAPVMNSTRLPYWWKFLRVVKRCIDEKTTDKTTWNDIATNRNCMFVVKSWVQLSLNAESFH